MPAAIEYDKCSAQFIRCNHLQRMTCSRCTNGKVMSPGGRSCCTHRAQRQTRRCLSQAAGQQCRCSQSSAALTQSWLPCRTARPAKNTGNQQHERQHLVRQAPGYILHRHRWCIRCAEHVFFGNSAARTVKDPYEQSEELDKHCQSQPRKPGLHILMAHPTGLRAGCTQTRRHGAAAA